MRLRSVQVAAYTLVGSCCAGMAKVADMEQAPLPCAFFALTAILCVVQIFRLCRD